jgi:hypothetical protein
VPTGVAGLDDVLGGGLAPYTWSGAGYVMAYLTKPVKPVDLQSAGGDCPGRGAL